MRKCLLVVVLLLGSLLSYGQGGLRELASTPKDAQGRYPFWRCATVEVQEARRSENPKQQTMEEFEAFMQKANALRKSKRANATADQIYYLPVVVHVIHQGEAVGTGANISFAQIQSQIDVLNEDFRRLAGSRGFNDHPDGADTRIEFVLANVDPNGNELAEPGVHRVRDTDLGVSGALNSYQVDSYVKPATHWDPNRYLNMWTANLGGGLLGYAQFPIGSGLEGLDYPGMETGAETDGVVMRYSTFGSTDKGDFPDMYPGYDKGRTTTHEVGHWLGLRHIWGDGGCGEDDFVTDTPGSDGPNYGCPTGEVSCGTVDMIENYMDYSGDECMNIFTVGQSERMFTVLEYSPRRNELLYSDVISGGQPRAEFSADRREIYQGQQVSFTDQSVGDIVSWSWEFEGGEPATSAEQNPVVTYTEPGIYRVGLTAADDTASYSEVKHSYIIVNETTNAPVADFGVARSNVFTGQDVQFFDYSDESVYSWSWEFEGGEPATSTEQNPVVTYAAEGTYGVTLTVTNSLGTDTKTIDGLMNVRTGAIIAVNPAEFIEELAVNTEVNRTLTISNSGNEDLTYSIEGVLYNGNNGSIQIGGYNGALAGGASETINVGFNANNLVGGVYEGAIIVYSNDPRNEVTEVPVTLNVSGTPDMSLSDSNLDFNTIMVGANEQRTLTIYNTGTDVLEVTPSVSTAVFSVIDSTYAIPVDESLTMAVTFAPSAVGTFTANLQIATNVPGRPEVLVALSGSAAPAPAIVVNPTEFNVTLNVGDSTTDILTIQNTGEATLDYSLSSTVMGASAQRNDVSRIEFKDFVEAKGERDTRVGHPVTTRSGDDGPDGFGYHWIDSKSANGPVFNWVDISSTGTPLSLGDDGYQSVNLPFSFPFYGETKSTAYVSANGFLSFSSSGASYYSNTQLPYSSLPNDIIAAYWTDLYPGNNVTYLATPEYFIVQFTNVPRFGGSGNMTFQYILYPSGEIKLQYLDMLESYYDLTIGIEDATGTGGMQIAFNTAFVENNLAVLISNSQAISFANYNGSIAPGGSEQVEVTFNAERLLGGTYEGAIRVHSNDPVQAVLDVPVHLLVVGTPEIAVAETSLSYGSTFIGDSVSQVVHITNTGNDKLVIDSLYVSSEHFSIDIPEMDVQIGETAAVEVKFAPQSAGNFQGTLTIESNASSNGLLEITLTGSGVNPPVMEASATELTASLQVGEASAVQNLSINNTGGHPLYMQMYRGGYNFQSPGRIAKERNVGFHASAEVMEIATELSATSTNKTLDNERIQEQYDDFVEGNVGMAWVNGELYVLQYPSGAVYKYDVEHEVAHKQFDAPERSYGLAWDGEYLWVGNGAAVLGYDLHGRMVGNFDVPQPINGFNALAYDATTSTFLTTDIFDGDVLYRITETGAVANYYGIPAEFSMNQLVVNNGTMWALDVNTSYSIYEFSLSGSSVVVGEAYSYPFPTNGYSLALDAEGALWAGDWFTLYKMDPRFVNLPLWVSADISASTIEVAEGGSYAFDVTFNAVEGMPVGTHTVSLMVESNDPQSRFVEIPFVLEVENSVPQRKTTIPAQSLMLGEETYQVDLTALFTDANMEDEIGFEASANDNKVNLAIEEGVLTVSTARGGNSEVMVYAVDTYGGRSEGLGFIVTVVDPSNNAPAESQALPAQELSMGDSVEFNLYDYFSDVDGDELTFEVTTQEEAVAIQMRGTVLQINGLALGEAVVNITVADDRGGMYEKALAVNVVEPLSVKDNLLAGLVTTYPNPFNGEIKLKMEGVKPGAYSLLVFDLQGRKVKAEEWEQLASEGEKVLDLKALPQGTYLLKIVNGEGSKVQRIIKQ